MKIPSNLVVLGIGLFLLLSPMTVYPQANNTNNSAAKDIYPQANNTNNSAAKDIYPQANNTENSAEKSLGAKRSLKVIIQGVDPKIRKELRDNLTPIDLDEQETLTGPVIEQYQQQAEQEINLTLQALGFYNATIQSAYAFKKDTWESTFTIILGPVTQISALHFQLIGEASHDPTFVSLFQHFPLKKGDVFSHQQYEQGKKDLLAAVIQAGYLNAVFSQHRVEVNPDINSSEIFLTLDSGPRHYFGPVSFETSKLSNRFLARYLPFKAGEIYSPEKVLILQSDLTQSNYFSLVNAKPVSQGDRTLVPIVVELEDAKPNQYLIGGGYGTDTGLRGKLGWTRRQVNSRGHRFNAQAQISEIYHKAQVEYGIPGKHPTTDQTKLTAGFFEDEYGDKPSRIIETAITEERDLYGWQRKLSLAYHHERFNEFETNTVTESKLILPSITLIQTKRDDLVNPTRGRRIEISLRGSIDALISDTSFLQGYLQIKWLHAFSPRTKVLVRTELGWTTPGDSERLPLSQRFFAGGDLSLRGYGYRTLPSEIDKNGVYHPVGGAYLGIGSIELVQMIKKPFGVFTFFDAGNAFRQADNEIAMGTGVGIEWQTRLGPIKLAIAKPLTKSADSWRIHANFGPEL